MKKDVLYDYVVLRLKSVEKHLKAYQRDKNPERLHRLRVDIKKIRAVFTFSKEMHGKKLSVKSLLPVFRKAGRVRDIKMHIKLLEKIPELPVSLFSKHKKNEALLTAQFLKNTSGYIRTVQSFHKKIALPSNLPGKKSIVKYFRMEQKRAGRKLLEKNRESMHSCRKKIKKLIYLYEALPKKLQKEIHIDKGELDRKQKLIGEWHDMYTAYTFLDGKARVKPIREYRTKLKIAEEAKFRHLFINT